LKIKQYLWQALFSPHPRKEQQAVGERNKRERVREEEEREAVQALP
jgi:hypothetical protein